MTDLPHHVVDITLPQGLLDLVQPVREVPLVVSGHVVHGRARQIGARRVSTNWPLVGPNLVS
ncbi:hypothetical protein ACFWN2_15640 [Lentzea sp. NPDC058436]|uniref:hypothetical protein n=1 Tax=Lentzea sp. NPDC058436 TaxID=3346499 RepID=UPI00365BF250